MFDQIAFDPLVAASAALLGLLIGLLLARLFLPGPKQVKRLQAEIERLGREHSEYQGRVAGHFQKTGELIGQMTQSYKAVYDHLADGAQTLCTADVLPKPAFTAPRLIVDDTVSIGAQGVRSAPAAETSARAATEAAAVPPLMREPAAEPLQAATPAEGGVSREEAKPA